MMTARFWLWLYEKHGITKWQVVEATLTGAKMLLGGIGIGLGIMIGSASQGMVASAIEYGTLPQIMEGIESIRRDSEAHPCNEFLQAQAATENRRMAYEQKSNERWLTGWASPDGWLDAKRIEVECGGNNGAH